MSKPQLIYIAGPITGLPTQQMMHDFEAAAAEWRVKGYAVINPSLNYGGSSRVTQAQYMRLSLAQLQCVDAVYMLTGWEQSEGARCEEVVARALGLEISYQ